MVNADSGATIQVNDQTLNNTVIIDKPLTLEGGVLDLSGHGRIRAGANEVTWRNTTFRGNTVALLADAAENYTDWRFENCTFEGVSLRLTKLGRTLSGGSTAATGTGVTDGSVITDCELSGYVENYTIEIAGVDDVQVRDSHIHDVGIDIDAGDGIKVAAGATNILIEGNTIEDCTRDGIDTFDAGTVPGPITIHNNTIRRCGAQGIDSKDDTEQIANAPEGDVMTSNVISNCPGGINSTKPDSVIQGNTVTDCEAFGIRIDGVGTPMNVSGNVCSGSGHDIRIGVILQGTITPEEQAYVAANNTYTTQNGLT